MDAQLTRFLRDVIRITATRSANNTRDLQTAVAWRLSVRRQPSSCVHERTAFRSPRHCRWTQIGRRARCQWKIQSGEATVTVLPQFGGAGVARGMHAELSKLLARSLHSQAAQTTELRSQRRQ